MSTSKRRPRSIADIRFQIARLELKPGDVLIVKVSREIGMDESKAIAAAIEGKQLLPAGAKYLIIDGTVDLSILSAAEIAARSAAIAPTPIEASMLDSSAVTRS